MNRFLAALAICAALTASASNDTVKVVKGQVSDYYIPVVTSYDVTGMVTDASGHPLEGTAPPTAIPMHKVASRSRLPTTTACCVSTIPARK